MSIFGWGDQTKAAGEGVEKVGNALNGLFTSDDERLTHAEVMERIKAKPFEIMGQLALVDAASRNWFQAGWRPWIGWVAGISLFLYFVPMFAVGAYMYVHAYITTGVIPLEYPVDPKGLFELVLALLGLGGFRMIEKMNGAAK